MLEYSEQPLVHTVRSQREVLLDLMQRRLAHSKMGKRLLNGARYKVALCNNSRLTL